MCVGADCDAIGRLIWVRVCSLGVWVESIDGLTHHPIPPLIPAEAAVAAIEAQGIRADLIMLTHLMQAYAVGRDVEGAKVRSLRCCAFDVLVGGRVVGVCMGVLHHYMTSQSCVPQPPQTTTPPKQTGHPRPHAKQRARTGPGALLDPPEPPRGLS